MQERLKQFRWVKYVVYVWAIRLGFGAFATFIPGGIGGIYHYYVGKDKSTIKVPSLIEEIKYNLEEFNPKSMIDSAVPGLVRGIPVLSYVENINLIRDFNHLKAPKNFHIYAKSSNSSTVYGYYDTSARWVHKYNISSPYTLIPIDQLDIFAATSQSECNPSNSSNWYLTQPLLDPLNNELVLSICPLMLDIVASLISPTQSSPSMNLWITGTSNITTRLHYDVDDNFLVQLSGSKRVMIVSPIHYPRYLSYPILHPEWRHIIRSNNSYVLNSDVAEAGIWTVELSPGDMLYMPPYYMHTTLSGTNSISLNLWMNSKYSMLYTKVVQTMQLPYSLDDPVGLKLASIGSFTKQVILLFEGNYDEFISIMKHKYQDTWDSYDYKCAPWKGLGDLPGDGVCNTVHVSLGANTKITRRVATLFHALLQQQYVPISIVHIMLLDYVEELLAVMYEDTSPCVLLNFVNTCVPTKVCKVGCTNNKENN